MQDSGENLMGIKPGTVTLACALCIVPVIPHILKMKQAFFHSDVDPLSQKEAGRIAVVPGWNVLLLAGYR